MNNKGSKNARTDSEPRGWFRHRLLRRLDAMTGLVLAALVLVLLNSLMQRMQWRYDFSRQGRSRLSEQTIVMLDQLSRDIEITVMVRPEHELATDVRDLLREYDYASPYLSLRFLDPRRDLIGVRALAEKYELTESDIILFESEGRERVVDLESVAEYDYLPVLYGDPRRLKSFRGESAFSSAIHAVSDLSAPVVYYLRGYNERDLNNAHPVSGFSNLARLLRDEHFELRELWITDAGGIPADADLVLVAGPRQRISGAEIEVLEDYLENQGRLMLLLEKADSGLESVLEKWGITVAPGSVGGVTVSGAELFVGQYGDHPITGSIEGMTTVFYRPRPLFRNDRAAPPGQADGLRVSLLAVGRELVDMAGKPVRHTEFDTAPAVAAAVEKGTLSGIDEQRRQSRMVVFGDIDFLSNAGMVAGNSILFVNALNWLVERDFRIEVAPLARADIELLLSRRQLSILLIVVSLAIPLVVCMFGLITARSRSGMESA